MKSLFSKEKWQQLFYTVSHPSDGFYWIRHGEKGSVAIAILMVVLFGLCSVSYTHLTLPTTSRV